MAKEQNCVHNLGYGDALSPPFKVSAVKHSIANVSGPSCRVQASVRCASGGNNELTVVQVLGFDRSCPKDCVQG